MSEAADLMYSDTVKAPGPPPGLPPEHVVQLFAAACDRPPSFCRLALAQFAAAWRPRQVGREVAAAMHDEAAQRLAYRHAGGPEAGIVLGGSHLGRIGSVSGVCGAAC